MDSLACLVNGHSWYDDDHNPSRHGCLNCKTTLICVDYWDCKACIQRLKELFKAGYYTPPNEKMQRLMNEG